MFPTKCEHCGAALLRERLKCVRCLRWNTGQTSSQVGDGTLLLSEVEETITPRLTTGPWDANFGDPPGIPTDSVTLLGGVPGVGKSTIALQWASAMAMAPENVERRAVLYLGAEENARQVKTRARRLLLPALEHDLIRLLPLERMATSELSEILKRPLLGVMVDSIPGLTNDPERAIEFVKVFKAHAVRLSIPFIVINHMTKGGDMAGFMALQHAGDITLLMTKEDDTAVPLFGLDGKSRDVFEPRTLKTEKSRYGPNVYSHYEMTAVGLIQCFEEKPKRGGDGLSVMPLEAESLDDVGTDEDDENDE